MFKNYYSLYHIQSFHYHPLLLIPFITKLVYKGYSILTVSTVSPPSPSSVYSQVLPPPSLTLPLPRSTMTVLMLNSIDKYLSTSVYQPFQQHLAVYTASSLSLCSPLAEYHSPGFPTTSMAASFRCLHFDPPSPAEVFTRVQPSIFGVITRTHSPAFINKRSRETQTYITCQELRSKTKLLSFKVKTYYSSCTPPLLLGTINSVPQARRLGDFLDSLLSLTFLIESH